MGQLDSLMDDAQKKTVELRGEQNCTQTFCEVIVDRPQLLPMQLLFSKPSLHLPIAEDDDDSLPKSFLPSPTARQRLATRPDVVLSGKPWLHSPFAEDDDTDLLPSRSSHNPPPATACSLNYPRMDFIASGKPRAQDSRGRCRIPQNSPSLANMAKFLST
ncbi:hypothetical protein HYDPIDRAFT_28835 [Hydnomerulius pinastri MD-312]|uniref:Uncharacterized protein n=1 Tax=Hydnomerulius pinastri MD-312 TaxID=994086 RepID=A0A0C9VED5_9AGAM|nr:hypothetical protein HYDPIDRAFT_28835 [Hydnomerulius pinastri MD-312]